MDGVLSKCREIHKELHHLSTCASVEFLCCPVTRRMVGLNKRQTEVNEKRKHCRGDNRVLQTRFFGRRRG